MHLVANFCMILIDISNNWEKVGLLLLKSAENSKIQVWLDTGFSLLRRNHVADKNNPFKFRMTIN